ncbi:MAG: ribonuclease HII [Candidatus Aminicenantes bacterium]|nr:ribonuclease HII [Candidatus Aminicenantes bacterium]
MADFQIEKRIIKRGFRAIAGVDEAGRGAIFGPVVAAAVILPPLLIGSRLSGWIEEIDDSKVISPSKRKRLAEAILANAFSVGVGSATNFEIDQKNIFWASLSAMRRAVESMPLAPDFILVDGFRLNDVNYPQRSIVQGDRKSISIAAASILAKVLRDEMMIHLDKIYEGYALSKNKGYGTREHYKALKKMGPTLYHRLTFNLRYK